MSVAFATEWSFYERRTSPLSCEHKQTILTYQTCSPTINYVGLEWILRLKKFNSQFI